MHRPRIKSALAIGLASAVAYAGCSFESIQTDPSKAPKQAKLVDGCDLDQAKKDLTELLDTGKTFTAYTAAEGDGSAVPWSMYSIRERTLSLSPVILTCKEDTAGFVGISQEKDPRTGILKAVIKIIKASDKSRLVSVDDGTNTDQKYLRGALTFLHYDADYFSKYDQLQPAFTDIVNDSFYGASITGKPAFELFRSILEDKRSIPKPEDLQPKGTRLA